MIQLFSFRSFRTLILSALIFLYYCAADNRGTTLAWINQNVIGPFAPSYMRDRNDCIHHCYCHDGSSNPYVTARTTSSPMRLSARRSFTIIVLWTSKQNDLDETRLPQQNYTPDRNEINQIIYSAASTVGNLSSNEITIEWKTSRIIVTVDVDQAYIDATSSDGIDDLLLDSDDNIDVNDDDDMMYDLEDTNISNTTTEDPIEDNEEDEVGDNNSLFESNETSESVFSTNGVDLTVLARAINVALDDGGPIGAQFAERYEIEVTTPGSADELTTPIMFAAYRGFDVLVQHQDSKSKKLKTFEGRLVEKNSEFILINMKGRMKHLKNSEVRSVKLPKAKKEKGVQ